MDQRRQVYKNMRAFSQLFILDNGSYVDKIRELKQRRRGRQRERQKSNGFD